MSHSTMAADTTAIYDEAFLKRLFDEMQSSYDRVCNVTSFGFNRRWRRQLVEQMALRQGMAVGDLMAGGGETWPYLLARIGAAGRIVAVDFSRQMVKQARARQSELRAADITVLEEDALCSSIASESQDAVICVYGVKTLSPLGQVQFVHEVNRILKQGGLFGLIEISVPPSALLRIPYLFYLSRIVPLVGKLLLGNPDNYRMLGAYTSRFARDTLRLLRPALMLPPIARTAARLASILEPVFAGGVR